MTVSTPLPTVGQLADAVQYGTRGADAATRRGDAPGMRRELHRVKAAINAALRLGLSDQLVAELRGRGFGADA